MTSRRHIFAGRNMHRAAEAREVHVLDNDWAEIPDVAIVTREQLEDLVMQSRRAGSAQRRGRIADPWDDLIGPPSRHNGDTSQSTRCMAAVEAGITVEEIIKYYPYINSGVRNNLQTAQSAYERKLSMSRNSMVCWLFQGATQTGKTTLAYNMAVALTGAASIDEAQFTLTKIGKGSTGQSWFDGYKRQKVLVLDEYRGDEYGCTDLLNWLNPRRPCILPIKGGTTWANWEYVFITTNNDISTWKEPSGYQFTEENRAALMGRINFVYDFKSKTEIDKKKVAPLTKSTLVPVPQQALDDIAEVKNFFS